VLEAHGVRARYRRHDPWVLDGVDLHVAVGEVVGLRGPSGTGKTTLARILSGHRSPQAGAVLVDGRPLPATGRSPVQLVFQHPELAVDPRWRLREVIAEAGEPDPELLRELGLPAWLLDRYPNELSGGELQRAAVARALTSGAPYLVADEVSAMLDAATQAQIWHAIVRRVDDGRLGVLAISHDDELLEAVAVRTVTLGATEGDVVPGLTSTPMAGTDPTRGADPDVARR
jgi:peptide/nickel transport system ATP-binding protein